MPKRAALALISVLALVATFGAAAPTAAADDEILSVMQATNDGLKAMWMDFRLESIEFFTVGQERSGVRLHQQPFRWVPQDPRRGSRDGVLSYLMDGSWGKATASGVPRAATEAAIRRAMATWSGDSCLGRVTVEEHPWDADDVTVTDFFLGTGAFGDPFAADIVFAGWVDDGESPLFRDGTLAVAATYVFVDRDTGKTTDVDGDGHMDVALNEIWFNDRYDWAIDGRLPAIDVETAALHEIGHALALGHFGLPPRAVMNPVYAGPRQALEPIDHSGLCSVWSRSR